MSRAFVNEDSAANQATAPIERHISEQPNYVTATGLEQLHAKVNELQRQHSEEAARKDAADPQHLADIERDLRYFHQRLQSAHVVAPATSTQKVQIGSWVTYVDEHGTQKRVQLVGEDQADAAQGLINWGSPLGRALLGAQPGDDVLWIRPAGDLQVEILAIEPAYTTP
ncbi:GreA/GreB family elongation factor [Pseudomonas sp. SIMBA_077]